MRIKAEAGAGAGLEQPEPSVEQTKRAAIERSERASSDSGLRQLWMILDRYEHTEKINSETPKYTKNTNRAFSSQCSAENRSKKSGFSNPTISVLGFR